MLEDDSKVLIPSDFDWLSFGSLFPFMFVGLIGLPALLRVLTGGGTSRILAAVVLFVSLLLWIDGVLLEVADIRLPAPLSPVYLGGGTRSNLLLAVVAVPMVLSGFLRGYGSRWPDVLHALVWVLLPTLWYFGL